MKTNRILIGLWPSCWWRPLPPAATCWAMPAGKPRNRRPPLPHRDTKRPSSAPAATDTPEKSASSGASDASPAAPTTNRMSTFWEAYELLQEDILRRRSGAGQRTGIQRDSRHDLRAGGSIHLVRLTGSGQVDRRRFDRFVQRHRRVRAVEQEPRFADYDASSRIRRPKKPGLKAGDLIIEVDGESIVGGDIYEQVAKVRGPEGSTPRLRSCAKAKTSHSKSILRAPRSRSNWSSRRCSTTMWPTWR